MSSALAAVERDWPVCPLKPNGKLPATRRGFLDATTDPEQITTWWSRMPDANIGIATGASCLVVVDLDVRNGVEVGLDSARRLADKVGDTTWCDTFTVRTARYGLHLYYRAPANVEVRNSAGKLGAGVDIRAAGGYVVGPGSRVDAQPYTALGSGVEVAPLPTWLLGLLTAPPAAQAPPAGPLGVVADPFAPRGSLSGLVRNVVEAVEGERNGRLHWSACRAGEDIAAGKLNAADAAAHLLDAAVHVGLGRVEAEKTIASGFHAQPRGAS